MDLLTIYHRAPIFMQNIFTSLKGYQNKRERNGQYYQQYMKFFERFDYSDESWLQEFQKQQLQRVIQVALTNSPFYQEFYQGLSIDDIQTVDDLKKLPVLEKELVRQNVEGIYTIPEGEGIVSYTSGTTGTPLKIIHTYEGFQLRNAFLDDFKRMHGFINGEMKKASFNSSEIVGVNQKEKVFWRDNLPLKQRLYSSYHTTEDNLGAYVDNLNTYQPASLDGYPSVLFEVARYINKHNIDLTFQPVAIFPTAETLLPHYRTEIEQAFQCQVYDQYASSEGSPFVVECAAGKLHYNMLSGVIEQDENNEMLITSFMNDGTPLIRYRIGDKIVFEEEHTSCSCGSALPLVKELQGRSTDYILSTSGLKITSVILSLASEETQGQVLGMQYVQKEKGHLLVNLIPDDGYTDEMDHYLIDKLEYYLGDQMAIEIRKVSEIEKDKSGKFKFVVNHLA